MSNFTNGTIRNQTEVYDSTQIGIIYAIVSPLVVFSNLVVIVVVVKSWDLRLPTMWNIAYMSVCDFLYGLHYMVFAVPSAFLKRFAYPDVMIGPASCLQTVLMGQNMLNILVAMIDRYLSICWPLRHSMLMSSKRFILANVITFVINLVHLCLIVLPDMDVFYNPHNAVAQSRFKSVVQVTSSTLLPLFVMVGIAGIIIRISVELHTSKRRIHPHIPCNDDRSLTISVSLSAFFFVLKYLWVILMLWGLKPIPLPLLNFAMFCLLSNSLWNVVIYALVFKPFMGACLRLFCPGYHRKLRQRELVGPVNPHA